MAAFGVAAVAAVVERSVPISILMAVQDA